MRIFALPLLLLLLAGCARRGTLEFVTTGDFGEGTQHVWIYCTVKQLSRGACPDLPACGYVDLDARRSSQWRAIAAPDPFNMVRYFGTEGEAQYYVRKWCK